MRRKLLCLLLCLVLLVSLVPAFGTTAFAADENGITNPPEAKDESKNLHLTKTLTPSSNGTYDITMESWASGEVKTQGIVEKVPTDFVVVVDQSGSMAYKDMPVSYDKAGRVQLETIAAAAEPTPGTANANGYYYLAEDGNYYRVYPVRDYLYEYVAPNTLYSYDTTPKSAREWFGNNDNASFTAKNSIFCLDPDGNFYQLYFDIHGGVLKYNVTPHYTRNDGSVKTFTPPENPWFHQISNGNVITPDDGGYWAVKFYWNRLFGGSDKYVFQELGGIRGGTIFDFPMYWRHTGYSQLAYRDINGDVHIVPANDGTESTRFCNDNGEAVTTDGGSTKMLYDNLYTYHKATNESRETSLKNALTQFAGKVAAETDSFGAVDNRISIVGFSSPGYSNNEVFTNTDRDLPSVNNGWQKDTADGNVSEYYGKALVGATNGTAGNVNSKITSAINAITSNGGTQPEYGLNMAYQILDNRGDNTTYTIRSGDKKDTVVDRNTVVIFFTDGQPGDYDNSNQYKEANDVVAQAYNIKTLKDKTDNHPLNTTVFSIGVFGESDGNPLTYEAHSTYSENEDYEFELGFTKRVGSYSYLNRNWLQNNPNHYGSNPNDTIFDYMAVVSSDYPQATQFMKIKSSNTAGEADTTGYADYLAMCAGVRGNYIGSNDYYRLASNQDTLIAAFLEVATMNSEETTSDTSVTLDTTAIFKDKVNTADFDASGATYTVTYQPVKVSGDEIVNDDSREASTPVNGEAYPAAGISHTGFNYSENYVTSVHPGYKLIVTISGLTPKKAVGELKSNDGNAGVYGPEDEEPTVSIASPTLQYPESASKTYLIDFNAKMTVATDATKMVDAKNDIVTGTNGEFVKAGTNVTYQLSSGNQASKNAEINKAYTDVDSATVYGKLVNVENAKLGWNQITTVPASSVYYDDDLEKDTTSAVTVGDGSGKITGVNDANVSMNATANAGTYYFTFYGTGIDVYCTTHSNGGFVSAAVFTGSGESACVKANRVGSAKTVRDYSAENIYNTPSVFFDGLPANTYTLKLVANDNAQFKLDGVRVYNPVKATEEGAATAAATELAKTPEANANYLNLRKVLLNDTGVGGFTVTKPDGSTDTVGDTVSGVLFIDDMSNIKTMSHYKQVYNAEKKIWENEKDENGEWKYYDEELPIYATEFDAYKANGPKNEIYLDGQQAITFQLSDKVPAGTKVWIGLSAPVDGSGSVSITGKDGNVSVDSVIDMYYDFTVPASRQITITNQAAKGSGDIISVTNLKITGIADLIPAATANNEQEVLHATKALFRPMTMKSVRMAANNGTDPEEETPAVTDEPAVTEDPAETEKPGDGSLVIDDPEETVTPTPTPSVTPDKPAETGNMIQKVIQAITKSISSFFKSIFRR